MNRYTKIKKYERNKYLQRWGKRARERDRERKRNVGLTRIKNPLRAFPETVHLAKRNTVRGFARCASLNHIRSP